MMVRKCCILLLMFLPACAVKKWKPSVSVKLTPGTVRNVVEMERNSYTMIKVSVERDW